MRLKFRTAMVGVILALGFGQAARADGLTDALAAGKRGDYVTELRLLKPLADQGNAFAQYNLGVMYATGQGVPKDDVEAVKYYRLAANQGYAPGQYNLGLMYYLGQGVPKDDIEAIKYFRLAANQENPAGRYYLGIMYANGQGVPKDDVEAYKWFNLEAANGDKEAGKLRDSIAAYMTPAQIAEAQKLSREWKPK
ncbi:MAG: sel1 repeat family protein [Hyphomicrobiales bacterium]|nr:sel1 repeat family protein [Hyphomicrobiales bacterium]